MPKTLTDLATAVLRELRVARHGEEPSADDRALIQDYYFGMYEEWRNTNYAYWPRDTIPDLVFIPVSKLIANDVKGVFNKPYDPGDAKQRLDASCAKPWSGATVRGLYY
jgi:hypothetical protein